MDHPAAHRRNRWVNSLPLGWLGLLDGFLPAWTDRTGIWTLDGDAIRWLGVLLFAAGGALRFWPVFVLGRRFSGLVAIQPGHTLVTAGIYVLKPNCCGCNCNKVSYKHLITGELRAHAHARNVSPNTG
jgi:isoprenylcysteine carboxyl methyltransferase (ICMT) family protein